MNRKEKRRRLKEEKKEKKRGNEQRGIGKIKKEKKGDRKGI